MYINQASDIAYEYIVERIRSGVWKPEDKIATESQLVDMIEVSKVAVRQAIERLVTMSVLKKVQGSGTYVEKKENMSIMSAFVFGMDDEFMMKILEFRKMFDSYNMELFIRRASEDEIIELQRNYAQMIEAKDDMQRFHKLDQIFHDLVANGTRNPMIIQISKLFIDIFVDNQKLNYYNAGPESAIKYHGKMLGAIKERNSEVASIYARMSIEESIHRLEELHSRKSDMQEEKI
jgi:GntR family transcriptional repressor for pyruvate dehydrogenase complex